MAFFQHVNDPFVNRGCPAFAYMARYTCYMKIDGKGSVFVQPDRASIVIGVNTENIQLAEAQRENSQKTVNVIAEITGLGVKEEDIRTQTYQIQPQYDFVNGEQVFTGYRVIHELAVEIENINLVGKVIDEAVEAGANMVGNISFHVTALETYYEMALNRAIGNAVAKADSVGRKINTFVNKTPIRIIEKTTANAVPMPYTAMQAVSGSTPVQPGIAEVTANIEAIFSYSCNITVADIR